MIGLIQLVKHADVKVNSSIVGAIQQGILALIGLEKTDTEQEAKTLFEKIINYRIFPDANGKTNLSLRNIEGGLLLVPQFTLVAETQKGLRPGFSLGMSPEEGKKLFEFLTSHAKKHYAHVATGQYGAYMQVSLCNDGPTTFLLKTA
jgi:D-tyrosyl-tRNA(Tyr) deacylase